MARIAVALLALLALGAAPAPAPSQCQPAPIVVPSPSLAPNSTYVSDGEPPERFGGVPSKPVTVEFGQASIDMLCGIPPCGMVFLGCTRGNTMALPDPFTVSSEQFAKIVRHELAHINGWPATHGD